MWFGIELSWGTHFDFYQCTCQPLAVFHIRHNCFVSCPSMMVPTSLLTCWSAFTLVTTFRTQVCQGQKCFGLCCMILFYVFTHFACQFQLAFGRGLFSLVRNTNLGQWSCGDLEGVTTLPQTEIGYRCSSAANNWQAESPTKQKRRGTMQKGSAESRVIRDVPAAAARERVRREPGGQRVIQSRNETAQRAEWSTCQQRQKRKRREATDEPTRPGASGQEWERQRCPPTQHHSGLGR